MRLSKQERIGALIILAIVILALGAFLLIKPKFEEVGRTKATLAERQNELQQAQERQSLKGGLKTQIEEQYEIGEHLADMFFPEYKSYEADDAFRAFLQQLDFPVTVESVTVGEPSTTNLSVSFYTPTEVSYALKTYVTQGITVEQTEEEQKQAARMAALATALAEAQTVGASTVSFTASMLTRADVLKFADAVNSYVMQEGTAEPVRKALSISGVTLEYSEVDDFYGKAIEKSSTEISAIGRDYMREDGFKIDGDQADNPNPETPANPENPGGDDENILTYAKTYKFTGTVTFHSIERMQDPKAQLDAQDGVAG